MSDETNQEGKITISIGGSVGGQFAVGRDIKQTEVSGGPVSPADLAELNQKIADLKAEVARKAPHDKQAAATEHLDELHKAITAGKPKLSTMEYVRDWFADNLPTMVGAVTSVIVNPIVGSLVKAGGDAVFADFKHRFPQA